MKKERLLKRADISRRVLAFCTANIMRNTAESPKKYIIYMLLFGAVSSKVENTNFFKMGDRLLPSMILSMFQALYQNMELYFHVVQVQP